MTTHQPCTFLAKLVLVGLLGGVLAVLAGCVPATPPPTATAVPSTLTPVPPTATAVPLTPTETTTPLSPETFYLDTRTKAVTSTIILASDHAYSVMLSGMFSNWDAVYWRQYGLCAGTPEPKPMFPSEKVTNSPVGEDPFYWFAFPKGPGTQDYLCGKKPVTVPSVDTGLLQFSLNGGALFAQYPQAPLYNPAHTYTISLVGKGYPLIIQQRDDQLADNRGQVKIDITP